MLEPFETQISTPADFVYDDVIVQCSDTFARLLNSPAAALLGKSLDEISPPRQTNGLSSVENLRTRINATRGGLPQSFEWQFLDPVNSVLSGILEIKPVADATSLHCSFQLINRADSAEQFGTGHNYLQQILDNSPAVVYIKNIEGQFLFVNKEFTHLFDRKEHEIVGKSAFDIFPREVAEAFLESDRKVFESKQPMEFEETATFKNRERRYISSKFPLLDSNGNVYAVCGISTDITSRSKTENALRNVALGVSGATGNDIFQAIVWYLANTLDVEYAFIARQSNDYTKLSAIAVYENGNLLDNVEYKMEGTPCMTVVGKEFRFIQDNVQQLYPGTELLAFYNFRGYAGFPLFDSAGNALGLIAVGSSGPLSNRDVVRSVLEIFSVRASAELERMTTDKVIRDNEEQYRSIFNASADGLVLFNQKGLVVDANPAFKRIHALPLNISPSEIRIDQFIPEESKHLYHQFMSLMSEDKPFHVYAMARMVSGERFHAEITGQRMLYRGQPHFLAIIRDITDKKMREEALLKSEDRLRATVEAALDSVIGMDSKGLIIEFNSAAESCFGFRRQEVINKPLADLIIPERYRAAHNRGMQKYLATAEGPYLGKRLEIDAQRKDGTEFPAELTIDVADGMDGKIFIAYLRDITERKKSESERARLEAQLRQAQKMEAIGHLTGGIAHDFNNILTSIMGYIVLASERVEQYRDEKLEKYLVRASRSGEKARDLIQQMLTFSRGQRGEPRALLLEPLIKEAVRLMEVTLPSSIEVELDIAPALPAVMIDPVHLEQILMNLCINARDAMNGQGQLCIGLRYVKCNDCICASCQQLIHGENLEIYVRDNGPGISQDIQERIFEPFFTTKEVGKGSGMGLAMVHGIVHEYGGHINVNSRAGQGATVSVLLKPIKSQDFDKTAPEQDSEKSSSRHSELHGRVLVVDDEEDVSEFMLDMLENWGLDVIVFNNSQAACDYIEKQHDQIDLIITDYTMPRVTGIELAKHARTLNTNIPVVLYTGFSESLSDDELKSAGIHALVRKPVNVGEMFGLVRAVLT